MKRNKQTHLHGHRGQAFADQIRGILPEQILCVSIDISKDFHVVLIHNGLGDIVRSSFEIDIFRHGFEQLCQCCGGGEKGNRGPSRIGRPGTDRTLL